MAWSNLSDGDVMEELAAPEVAAIKAIKADDNLARFVARAVAECRGAISGGGYPLGEDGTVPAGLLSDVIAVARWRWLISIPQLVKLQTKERKEAFEAAEKKFSLIAQQKFAPESPTTGTNPASGNWNAENKIIGRTHPVPAPSVQRSGTGQYANPDGPVDV